MRTKKATINSLSNIIIYIAMTVPAFLTRRVFIDKLGTNLAGLNGIYANIVMMLSIVELGVGTAIIYSLYKPFAENDREKVKSYLDFYKKFYIKIGLVILAIGIALLPILPMLIKGNADIKGDFNMVEGQIYFVLYLLTTVMSYLFTYKICILNVAQEGYIASSIYR